MSLVVMLAVVWGLGWVVTSIERTAYPRFKRLITTHELHLCGVRAAGGGAAGGTLPVYRAAKTMKNHRGLVRQRVGVAYDQARARRIAGESIRKEAASKNRPADLINIALEKVVEAGLEPPAFSTFDAMASTLRKEVNAEICGGIHKRMSAFERAGLLRLLEERERDGTTLYNRLKKPAQGPTWSHFKNLAKSAGMGGRARRHGRVDG
ncbi:hypothetical protein [Streptomyces griseoruber]|uniref:hypothetical protein n=1 Tax=Streptomyces griseoruber TaxID=1943 RepID=UPI0037BADDA9